MPFLLSPRTQLRVALSDRVYHETRFKQYATFSKLVHEQVPDGQCCATITVLVQCYSADAGGYGEPLHGLGVPDREVALTADNDAIVDAATGELLRIRKTGAGRESDLAWQAAAEEYEQAVMLQGDFFELLRHYCPIDIEGMIVQHITQADAMGRFQ